MERVAAVVVTYNRKELLARCIEALLGQQNAVCDILIVDNASTDGTGAYLAALNEPRVHSRSTGANLGGAGGFNFGIRWAVEAGYDLVWIMDDDTLPHPDSLAQLLAAHTILGGNYGFLSSAVLWTDGTECKMNRQKIKKNFYEHVELLRHGLILVEQATFVSLLFPAAAIEKAGLPIRDDWRLEDRDDQGKFMPFSLPHEMPEAFVCNCDEVAYNLVETLKRNGYRVPQDVAVTGYDDYRYSTICSPQLTSYRVDLDGMAKTVVAQLRRKMAHKPAVAPTVIVPGGFVRREST